MRYIGNKESLVEIIFHTMKEHGIIGQSIFDVFSGTANVGRFFKKKGYQVFACDLMYYSYVLQQAYLSNNSKPVFSRLLPTINVRPPNPFSTPLQSVLTYLNDLPSTDGFIYGNYTPDGKLMIGYICS